MSFIHPFLISNLGSFALLIIKCGCIFRPKLHTGLARWYHQGFVYKGIRISHQVFWGQKWIQGPLRKLIGAGKVTMLEGAVGVRREDFENRLRDGGKRVRSTSLGELKSNNSSSSSETFSAARRLVLDSVLGRVSNSQAAVVRRKAVHQVITSQEMWFFNYKPF